jgi:hypothetical protein
MSLGRRGANGLDSRKPAIRARGRTAGRADPSGISATAPWARRRTRRRVYRTIDNGRDAVEPTVVGILLVEPAMIMVSRSSGRRAGGRPAGGRCSGGRRAGGRRLSSASLGLPFRGPFRSLWSRWRIVVRRGVSIMIVRVTVSAMSVVAGIVCRSARRRVV